MRKIRLFSTKATKGIEGDEAELYVNFYLVLNRTYIFTFLINAPNLSCTDRHPIKLWKDFLIMLEEENVKYMRRYEKWQKESHRKVRPAMKYVSCYCSDCVHNDGDGECDQDYITINNDTMTAAGFYPMCEDYEEKKEASTNE